MGRFRSFLVRCMSFQIVADRFRSFQVVPRFSNYRKKVKAKNELLFLLVHFLLLFILLGDKVDKPIVIWKSKNHVALNVQTPHENLSKFLISQM